MIEKFGFIPNIEKCILEKEGLFVSVFLFYYDPYQLTKEFGKKNGGRSVVQNVAYSLPLL